MNPDVQKLKAAIEASRALWADHHSPPGRRNYEIWHLENGQNLVEALAVCVDYIECEECFCKPEGAEGHRLCRRCTLLTKAAQCSEIR